MPQCALFLVLCCAVGAGASRTWGIETARHPPGVVAFAQHALLAEMLGRGTALPGGCQFAGATVDGARITAQYACDTGRLVVELQATNEPVPLRTAQFAITVRSGSAPAGLTDALGGLVRRREARLEWQTPVRMPPSYSHRILGALGIMAATLLASYVAGGRRSRRRLRPSADLGPARRACRRTAGRRLAAVGFLTALYLATRLWHLTRLPVFIDEALHIEWARASLTDYFAAFGAEVAVGKWLPLQFMTAAMLLPCSPLASARLLSVAMGLLTLAACVLINMELFALGEGVLAGAVYTILPFALLYDRMALADIYLTASAAWALYAALVMRRSGGRLAPTALSACVVAALLSKPSGGLFLAVPVAVSALLVAPGERRAYLRRCLPALLGGAALLAFLVHEGYGTNLLAAQSQLGGVHRIGANIATAGEWLATLLTPAVATATAIAALWALGGALRRRRADAFLDVLLMLAIVPFVLVSKVWYPRYLLFVTVPVSLLLGRAIAACAAAIDARSASRLPKWAVAASLTGALALFAVPADLALIIAPETAHLPAAERAQYISGGNSGYGFAELAAFLRAQAREGPINVVRSASPGPINQSLNVYLDRGASMNVFPTDVSAIDDDVWPWSSLSFEHQTRQRTLFVVSRDGEAANLPLPSRLPGAVRIWMYTRPDGESALEVWEVPRPRESR